jgi:hypothetical protein
MFQPDNEKQRLLKPLFFTPALYQVLLNLMIDSVISFLNNGATLLAVSCTSACVSGVFDIPAAMLAIQDTPQIFIPI